MEDHPTLLCTDIQNRMPLLGSELMNNCDEFWSTNVSTSSNNLPSSSDGHNSARNDTQTNNTVTWKVGNLRPVPFLHPLEASALTIEDVDVEIIVTRIVEFLRMNSIAAIYWPDQAECRTGSFLNFSILLWRGSNNQSCVVEVQRRRGCCIEMRRVRKNLVGAILQRDRENNDSRPQHQQLPFMFCQQNRHIMPPLEWSSRAQTETKREGARPSVEHLLQSRSFDQNRLGMEFLCFLSNQELRHDRDTNDLRSLCLALISGQGRLGTTVRNAILKYFPGDESIPGFDTDSTAGRHEDSGYHRSHFITMHLLALEIFNNALKMASQLQENGEHIDIPIRSSIWQGLVRSMVCDVENAENRPQEAAIASQCLCELTKLIPQLKKLRMSKERLLPALCRANGVGRSCHMFLERTSSDLMEELEESL